MHALIVIPTYDERDNLPAIVAAALAVTPGTVEVLVVDDNSPDGTGDVADAIVAREPRVHVLHREGKRGLGTAYVDGFRWGLAHDYAAFIEMDADFSHDPEYLPAMLTHLAEVDVAIGSRYVDGGGTVNWGLGRKILSRGGSLYARLILGAGIRDFTGGFNGWRRQVLSTIDLDTLFSDGYSFQIELKYRAFLQGYTMREFPIVFADRRVGESKMSRAIVIEAMARVWRFRFQHRRAPRRP